MGFNYFYKAELPWFKYTYTFTPKTIILFNQEVPRDLSSQGDSFLHLFSVDQSIQITLSIGKKIMGMFSLEMRFVTFRVSFQLLCPLKDTFTMPASSCAMQLIPGEHTGRIRNVR